jgi:hypothetical protein
VKTKVLVGHSQISGGIKVYLGAQSDDEGPSSVLTAHRAGFWVPDQAPDLLADLKQFCSS